MSSFKPRKVAAASFFTMDQREEKKFWYLDPVVQPVVQALPDGTFQDPRTLRPPLAAAVSMFEANGVPGVDAIPAGLAGEIVEIRSSSVTSNAGGNYALLDDGVQVSAIVAIGVGALEELVTVPIPVAGASVITLVGGLAADAWNIRGVRL